MDINGTRQISSVTVSILTQRIPYNTVQRDWVEGGTLGVRYNIIHPLRVYCALIVCRTQSADNIKLRLYH